MLDASTNQPSPKNLAKVRRDRFESQFENTLLVDWYRYVRHPVTGEVETHTQIAQEEAVIAAARKHPDIAIPIIVRRMTDAVENGGECSVTRVPTNRWVALLGRCDDDAAKRLQRLRPKTNCPKRKADTYARGLIKWAKEVGLD